MSTGMVWRRLAAVALISGLSACDTVSNITNVFEEPVLLPCPTYVIPADSAQIVAFRAGTGRDLIDVEFSGRIVNMQTACKYSINRDTNAGHVDVDMAVQMEVERGPANRNRQAAYPFFIAVTDADKNILYREELSLRVSFAGNQNRQSITAEKVVLEVPLKAGQDGRNFLLFTGFVLNREQLEYNRKLRASRLRSQ